jgi:hypothetical protein
MWRLFFVDRDTGLEGSQRLLVLAMVKRIGLEAASSFTLCDKDCYVTSNDKLSCRLAWYFADRHESMRREIHANAFLWLNIRSCRSFGFIGLKVL